MKILVATDKPFAPVAVTMIREVVEKAGHTLALLLENRNRFQQSLIVEIFNNRDKVHVRIVMGIQPRDRPMATGPDDQLIWQFGIRCPSHNGRDSISTFRDDRINQAPQAIFVEERIVARVSRPDRAL